MSLLTEFKNLVMLADPTVDGRTLHVPSGAIDVDNLVYRISRLIKRETNLGVQEMQVCVENDCLILRGYCRTFYTKQMAQQAVLKILGDIEMVNEIRVV